MEIPLASKCRQELSFALGLARDAGELLLKHFQAGVSVKEKPDKTPVTIADQECERLIREQIAKTYPGDAVLGEEEGESKADDLRSENKPNRKWIVDPLDGTYNFARGIPVFSVLLALEEEGEIVLGVVFNPARQELYYAEKGGSAFKNGKQIHVSEISKIEESQFLFGGPNRILQSGLWEGFTSLMQDTYRQRGLGDYLNFAYVFEGKGEAALETGLYAWDLAPMKVIVEEAGGKFSDLSGGSSVYTGNCLVSNGKVHEAFLARLKMP